MCFWNVNWRQLACRVIPLGALSFLEWVTLHSVQFSCSVMFNSVLKPGLENFEHYFTSMCDLAAAACEMSATVW